MSQYVLSSSDSSLSATQRNTLKRKRDDEDNETKPPPPPSWEALCVLGPYVESKTLCAASCVSKTWWECFSSEDLWKIKRNDYESYNFTAYDSIATETKKSISYKRQVINADKSAKRRRKTHRAPPKISLSDLVFTVYVSSGLKNTTVLKEGKDLVFGSDERFQIEADVSDLGFVAGTKEVRMVLHVTCRVRDTMFEIMDFTGSSLETNSGWLTKELPTPEDSFTGRSDLVGDIKPSFDEKVLDKVGFAFLNSGDNSSLFVDDVLRYLQRFLLD